MIKVESSHKLDHIEKRVIEALKKVDANYLLLGRQTSKWTRDIKNKVGAVGHDLKYEVYASQSRYWRNGEWAFDVTWSKEKGDITTELPLVLESEWDLTDILWDFTKLLIARASHRVMVFGASTSAQAQKTIELMLRQIREFRGTSIGDRYLFCYWTDKPDTFTHQLYIIRKAT
jgi:hypothetical protein